jgi:hypothetical protein
VRAGWKIRPVVLLLLLLAGAGIGVGNQSSLRLSRLIRAEPWPQADALFHSDPQWLGGDGAYSVDLGNQHVLWLFGDSFINMGQGHTRTESAMVRNSVAIESGYDPSAAAIHFYWRTRGSKPESFFPEKNGIWYWPGHGVVVGEKLLIFLMAVRPVSTGLGFESAGWNAVIVPNFRSSPLDWKMHWLKTPLNPFHASVTGPVLQEDDHLYVFSYQDPGFNVLLVRWPLADVTKGDLSRPEWWNGEAGWVLQRDLREAPTALAANAQAEFSVNFQPALKQFLMIQTNGFGQADIAFRYAHALTGPWTSLRVFYRPPEYEIPGIMIYAAKYHPELQGAPMVVTYATNTFKLSDVLVAPDLYYPRFLKVSLNENRLTR